MTAIVIVFVIVLGAVAFGICKYQQQKRSADKAEKDKREAELLEQWKARQGQSGQSGHSGFFRDKLKGNVK